MRRPGRFHGGHTNSIPCDLEVQPSRARGTPASCRTVFVSTPPAVTNRPWDLRGVTPSSFSLWTSSRGGSAGALPHALIEGPWLLPLWFFVPRCVQCPSRILQVPPANSGGGHGGGGTLFLTTGAWNSPRHFYSNSLSKGQAPGPPYMWGTILLHPRRREANCEPRPWVPQGALGRHQPGAALCQLWPHQDEHLKGSGGAASDSEGLRLRVEGSNLYKAWAGRERSFQPATTNDDLPASSVNKFLILQAFLPS